MPIERARDLQTLYDEVADHDLVVVPDNPLADALNRRVETPQFGTFATTPRRLATDRREGAEDRRVFLAAVDRTDHDWKDLAHAIGNVLDCWKHEGAVDAIREYDAYVDDTTEDVLDVVRDVRTTTGQLSEYAVDGDQSVAVVGHEQLTDLERSILPPDHDRVALFADEPFDRPPFHVFDSSADVVEAVMDTVHPDRSGGTGPPEHSLARARENAGDVAVVLDKGSRYATLVRSALAAADVPAYGGPGFVDDPDHRAFLGLLRTAFRGSETTVGDVRPIFASLGVEVDVAHDEKRLGAVDLPGIEWLTDFCDGVDALTFGEAAGEFAQRVDGSMAAFREELDALGLADEPVGRRRVADLTYYLQTYEVPVDRENEGVLLADPRSSGYVDRPVVFHVGLDDEWTHAAPRRPWADADADFDRHVRRFQLLLQSGTEQYYLVQDTAGGQPVTPCHYLGELVDEEFERFSDLESVHHTRPPQEATAGFAAEPLDVNPSTVETVSQSSLNTYVNCPRDYFFDRLLDSPEKDYFLEGTLFHDFAEFYVDHADVVDGETVEAVVDAMLAETAPFFHDGDEPLRRRRYRVGVETIAAFLDDRPPAAPDFLTPASGWGDNFFAEFFDRPVESPLTERWFENVAVGGKGLIDLVRGPDHLVDYKSGHRKSASRVVANAAVDPPADTPDFQAAMYLSHFRTEQPDTRIDFTFCHFLETLDDYVTGEPDMDDALTTVTYHPETFDTYAASRAAYDTLLDGYNDCVETFDALGFERYREILAGREWPGTTEKDELLASPFAGEFTRAVAGATGDGVDAEKGCEQALRELNGVRKRSFFREDLDAFESFLAARIEELNRRRLGEERFPVAGLAGEPNYRRVDHRDLLLAGDDAATAAGGERDD
ncbi:MAG: PD-(D/E)XK nuclease family protein [Halorientalis sp.]